MKFNDRNTKPIGNTKESEHQTNEASNIEQI